jgi:hypothetical protein
MHLPFRFSLVLLTTFLVAFSALAPGQAHTQSTPGEVQPADGWNSPRALELVRLAQNRRSDQIDGEALRSYQARGRAAVQFLVDHPQTGRENLVRTDQVALELFWRAPDHTRQHIVGVDTTRRTARASPVLLPGSAHGGAGQLRRWDRDRGRRQCGPCATSRCSGVREPVRLSPGGFTDVTPGRRAGAAAGVRGERPPAGCGAPGRHRVDLRRWPDGCSGAHALHIHPRLLCGSSTRPDRRDARERVVGGSVLAAARAAAGDPPRDPRTRLRCRDHHPDPYAGRRLRIQ